MPVSVVAVPPALYSPNSPTLSNLYKWVAQGHQTGVVPWRWNVSSTYVLDEQLQEQSFVHDAFSPTKVAAQLESEESVLIAFSVLGLIFYIDVVINFNPHHCPLVVQLSQ